MIVVTAVLAGCQLGNDGLQLSGTLQTDDLDLIAPFTAKLLTLKVAEGDTVAAGDTLAILDTISVSATYRAALARERQADAYLADLVAGTDIEDIRAAAAQAEIAQATLRQRERDLARADSLSAAGVFDEQSRELAQLNRDNAASALESAREILADLERGARTGQIAAARAAWEQSAAEAAVRKQDYDLAFLITVHSGVVQLLPYQIGETVPAGRAVVTVHNPDLLWALVYVPEHRLGEARLAEVVGFTVDAFPGQTYKAEIVRIASEAEFTPRNVQTPDERLNLVFAVKLKVLPGQDGPRAGMPADFDFR